MFHKKYLTGTTQPKARSDKWCIVCDKYIYRNKQHIVHEFQFPTNWLYFIPTHIGCAEEFVRSLK